eukprot:g14834.t1
MAYRGALIEVSPRRQGAVTGSSSSSSWKGFTGGIPDTDTCNIDESSGAPHSRTHARSTFDHTYIFLVALEGLLSLLALKSAWAIATPVIHASTQGSPSPSSSTFAFAVYRAMRSGAALGLGVPLFLLTASYNAIFSELAAQAKANNEGEEGRGAATNPRRATVAARGRYTMHGIQMDKSIGSKLVMPKASRGLGLGGRRPQLSNAGERPASIGGSDEPRGVDDLAAEPPTAEKVSETRRRSSSEELFPGFMEGKKEKESRLSGGGKEALDPPGCRISFGDTLPSGSARRLSESQGLADSCSFNNGCNSNNKPLRRAQIFDKGVDASMMQDLMNDGPDAQRDDTMSGGDGDRDRDRERGRDRGLGRTGLLQNPASMGEQSADIVIGALQKFFFVEYDPEEAVQGGAGGQSGGGGGMAMLTRAMERQECEAGTSLVEQGEEGHHMFVVEQGSLEVIIDEEAIREIGVGDRFGELALLYNAPRSASVRSLSPCVLWSIHREVFKAVQALTASGNLIARSTHLYHVPWLRLLSTTDLSKLAECFQTAQYRDGDVILREGQVSFGKGCFLGMPVLLASSELEIDGLRGWELSPPRPSSSGETLQLQSQDMYGDDGDNHDAEDGNPIPQPKSETEGAVAAEAPNTPTFSAISPVHVVARGDVKIGYFDVARFIKSIGPFAKVLGGWGTSHTRSLRDRRSISRQSLVANTEGARALKHEKLSVHSFERVEFLGQGSFGFVTMVRKKEGVMEGCLFALKSLSKLGVVEGGQVQHIKDEKSVLELFNHPFILKLYTTFQDANRVYFLTELLTGGELWSVIYESSSGFSSGLPPDHVKFYSAVVVDALGYMHKKGIAYRDLKPENLIVDEIGYLRIIDMGFAKQIPFFVKVLMFEMVEARTPFVLPGSEQDIAQLFTNIACVKKRGVDFPDDFDDKAGGSPNCRNVISGMLAFEPGDRIGYRANGMNDVKAHPMYEGLEWERLEGKLIQAPWVPDAPASFPEPELINASDVYNGNQDFFANF